jgi:hypothetical protein
MRLFRRKPKFTHPCPACRKRGFVAPHRGQHLVSDAPASGPPLTALPPPASPRTISLDGVTMAELGEGMERLGAILRDLSARKPHDGLG